MKTIEQHLSVLDKQIDSQLDMYKNKVQNSAKADFDKIFNDFKSSLATISTETIHNAILDGITNDDFVQEVRKRTIEATLRFTSLIS